MFSDPCMNTVCFSTNFTWMNLTESQRYCDIRGTTLFVVENEAVYNLSLSFTREWMTQEDEDSLWFWTDMSYDIDVRKW